MLTRLFCGVLALLALLFALQTCTPGAKISATDPNRALITALRDSLRYSRDQFGRETAQKRAIEADLGAIKREYADLSGNQRQLLAKIGRMKPQDRKNLVSATRIEQKAAFQAVDRVLVPVYGADLAWQHDSDTLSYDIRVKDSTLIIHDLRIPNGLIVTTFRDKKADLHVQVINTNPLYKTQDVDTIVPPEPQKRSWVGKVLLFVAGALVGGAISAR